MVGSSSIVDVSDLARKLKARGTVISTRVHFGLGVANKVLTNVQRPKPTRVEQGGSTWQRTHPMRG
eukprot:127644-Amorphochlora_amoeboformis.AAC.1